MFKVYHSRNMEDMMPFGNKQPDEVALTNYDMVAYVDASNLDVVFHHTNHIDHSWWENDGVELIKESRSTSVGDLIIEVDGFGGVCGAWLVSGVGFKKVGIKY